MKKTSNNLYFLETKYLIDTNSLKNKFICSTWRQNLLEHQLEDIKRVYASARAC